MITEKISDRMVVINPQGADAETGIAFPEVVHKTTDYGQVLWLNSSPKTTLPQKPQSPTREIRQESLADKIWRFFTEEGKPGRGNLSSRVGRQETGEDENGNPTYWDH